MSKPQTKVKQHMWGQRYNRKGQWAESGENWWWRARVGEMGDAARLGSNHGGGGTGKAATDRWKQD